MRQSAGKFLILNKKILESFEQKPANIAGNIKYWLKTGKLLSLKNGWYVFKEKFDKEMDKDSYLEYIATQMVQPSYLSLEYVMAKYELLTEAVYGLTIITTKSTREILNKLGAFRYYTIAPGLFSGYKLKYFLTAPIFEASKEKAIFDFLYLRFLKNTIVSEQAAEELRLNWTQVNKREWRALRGYAERCRSARVREIIDIIGKKYFSD